MYCSVLTMTHHIRWVWQMRNIWNFHFQHHVSVQKFQIWPSLCGAVDSISECGVRNNVPAAVQVPGPVSLKHSGLMCAYAGSWQNGLAPWILAWPNPWGVLLSLSLSYSYAYTPMLYYEIKKQQQKNFLGLWSILDFRFLDWRCSTCAI